MPRYGIWKSPCECSKFSLRFSLFFEASNTFFVIHSKPHSHLSHHACHQYATTFSATAVFEMLLGEETHLGNTLFCTALIVLGVWLCITIPQWLCNLQKVIFYDPCYLGFSKCKFVLGIFVSDCNWDSFSLSCVCVCNISF